MHTSREELEKRLEAEIAEWDAQAAAIEEARLAAIWLSKKRFLTYPPKRKHVKTS